MTYNGTTWSKPLLIDPKLDVEAVSCPTQAFCAAVDYSGQVMTYNGTTWSKPLLVDPNEDLISVSCPSTTLCVALDEEGDRVKGT
jgi:hypothetical protein